MRGASWIVPSEVMGISLSWNFLPLKDDVDIVFHDWVEGDNLGDFTYRLYNLSLLLLGVQLELLKSARIVLIRITFFRGGSLAAASRSLIFWVAPFAMNSVQ